MIPDGRCVDTNVMMSIRPAATLSRPAAERKSAVYSDHPRLSPVVIECVCRPAAGRECERQHSIAEAVVRRKQGAADADFRAGWDEQTRRMRQMDGKIQFWYRVASMSAVPNGGTGAWGDPPAC
jgi:hypothetical protein